MGGSKLAHSFPSLAPNAVMAQPSDACGRSELQSWIQCANIARPLRQKSGDHFAAGARLLKKGRSSLKLAHQRFELHIATEPLRCPPVMIAGETRCRGRLEKSPFGCVDPPRAIMGMFCSLAGR